ncbi:hypothetical protein [Hugenholtzia roseola]|uniref:hypothetical protein n=1 Tax=Hugenholtzia roseola TaxID=1002 RepID=UPI0012B601BC|nr:hypothetical protein [Hugenholtzia roseola]
MRYRAIESLVPFADAPAWSDADSLVYPKRANAKRQPQKRAFPLQFHAPFPCNRLLPPLPKDLFYSNFYSYASAIFVVCQASQLLLPHAPKAHKGED